MKDFEKNFENALSIRLTKVENGKGWKLPTFDEILFSSIWKYLY